MTSRDLYDVRITVEPRVPEDGDPADSVLIWVEAAALCDIADGVLGAEEACGYPTDDEFYTAADELRGMLACVAMHALNEARMWRDGRDEPVVSLSAHRALWRCTLDYIGGIMPGAPGDRAPHFMLVVHKDKRAWWLENLRRWLKDVADPDAARQRLDTERAELLAAYRQFNGASEGAC